MKWSSVAAVLAAPLALAGSVQRDIGVVARRSSGGDYQSKSESNNNYNSGSNNYNSGSNNYNSGSNSNDKGNSNNDKGNNYNDKGSNNYNDKGNSDYNKGSNNYNGDNGKGSNVVDVSSTTVILQEVIIIWVNNGGGATTSQVNSATTAAAAAGSIQTHTVIVGGGAGLVYTPNSVSAAVGDMVVFSFESQNHTATQSAFTTPCEALSGGMDTGFMPNPNNTVSPPPQMAMQVKVSTPIWFYCRQKGHCGKGMTFSINPTASKTQAMFEQMAIAQNGTGAAAPIVGGTPPPAAAPPASSPAAAAPPPPAAAPPAATVIAGSGSGSGSACSCSCFCGTGSFPSPGQGVAAFGGLSGSLPMSAMMKA